MSQLNNKKIGFIGGGQMAEAILSGMIKAGLCQAECIYVADIAEERLLYLKNKYGVNTFADDSQYDEGCIKIADNCDIIVLAVKPQVSKNILENLQKAFWRKDQLVISIIGGLKLSFIESYIKETPVIRVIPNTPMLVNMGASGISLGRNAKGSDGDIALLIFNSLGIAYVVDEKLIDAVTSVSGTGPAYVYMFIEAMADGGVEMGLTRAMAQALAAQTVMGAAKMVLETGEHPGRLKDNVCSPGGATIAGVRALEKGGFRGIVMDAVEAGKVRMEEVGKKAE